MTTAVLLYGFYDESERLRRIALLASSFFIEDRTIRMEYIKEIDDFINSLRLKITSSTSEFSDQNAILEEIRKERESTEKEYQRLRTGDYIKYIVTDIFEDQGVLKYVKIASGVVSGGFQTFAGYKLNQFGKTFHIKHFKSFGILLIAHGANNMYEAASPLFNDGIHKSGTLRNIYRYITNSFGYNNDDGDLLYSAGDLSLTLYAAFRTPVLFENPNRLVSKGFMDSPRAIKLFYYVNKDHISKFSSASNLMKMYMVGNSARKVYAEFKDGNYIYSKN
ncbi:hypothetical protein Dda3937_01417 [Dickeya dadantii 3937]|uniref:DUF4225 domain-containing protein n=2 Tax=Dickeya dadantii TaxID=204038 RepID=E0SB38_DICD3|nr:DUF4225 domain-containing protein [Dickeya dadantii]ADM97136.1 hypothetical protein Dda3937_01417 [Dickeya dadantii 3937]